jgi:hypothetical protein
MAEIPRKYQRKSWTAHERRASPIIAKKVEDLWRGQSSFQLDE